MTSFTNDFNSKNERMLYNKHGCSLSSGAVLSVSGDFIRHDAFTISFDGGYGSKKDVG